MDQPFVTGSLETAAGPVPRVSSSPGWKDRLGALGVRWDAGRMNYTVDPGLYALGSPGDRSPVLVSANYKLSFDILRKALGDRSVWILVLDTNGINVWCAAGKGTFGTAELVERVRSSGLGNVVSHRDLVLPQLSAPGVAAHLVKKQAGFRVHYGPIRAKDAGDYLDRGFQATPAMRRKTFTLKERAEVIPVELVQAFRKALPLFPLFFLAGGLGGGGGFWESALRNGGFAVFALFVALLAGSILPPLLLPWLPGRAFSVKGLFVGFGTAILLLVFRSPDWSSWTGRLEAGSWLLLVPAIAAYLAMNFTGASTYTSLSGVRKEMRFALPLEIVAAALGLVLWAGSLFVT